MSADNDSARATAHHALPPLRVALIGYGYSGKTFHAPLIAATPGLELACVVSRDAGKVRADLPDADVVADLDRALHDARIDLVVIATPNDTHAPLARAALEAGKHVVIDKPFALTLDEARVLASQAERAKRVLSVFHNRRWDSDFLGVRRCIGDGLLGDVVHFESHIDRFRPAVRARWREQNGPGAGLWFDLGPHLVDQTLQLFGLPDRVTGHLATQRAGGMSNDWAHVVLDYGRHRAVLQASMLAAGGSARFTVHGTRGSLVKMHGDPQEAQLLRGLRPDDPQWGEDADAFGFHDGDAPPPRSLPAPRGDQRRYYIALRDALLGRGDNPVTPAQAIAVMAVIEAAQQSALEHRSMTLALADDERRAFVFGSRGKPSQIAESEP